MFGDEVPWWIKNKAPIQISPSAKSLNLIKEKLGEDFMKDSAVEVATEDAQEATEADETIADEYEEEEEQGEEEEVDQASFEF